MSIRFVWCLALVAMTIGHCCTPADVSADLHSPFKLASSEMHVVGIYSPKDHGKDDRVIVEVRATEKPVVLVLSGYFGAQWNVRLAEDAELSQVIVAGYFEHSVTGVPESVPVEMITYFPKNEDSRNDYFWAYSWHTQNGRQLRERLTKMTGLRIVTFQGEYAGEHFVVDGKRGFVSDIDRPKEMLNTDAPAVEEAIKKLKAALAEVRTKRSQAEATFGAGHPRVRDLKKVQEDLENQLSRVGIDVPEEESEMAAKSPTANLGSPADQRSIIEELVRKAFQLETELQAARVEKAEADLKRVKAQLERRKNASEALIAQRVEDLLRDAEITNKDDRDEVDGSAALLASEGWAAWQKQDWRTASTKFQAALRKDSKSEAAINGMGWTHLHLGEYDQAIARFRELLKDTPSHPGALNGVGQSLLAMGKLDEAEKALLDATNDLISQLGEAETARRGVACWYGLVRVYLQKKDYDSAVTWAESYVKANPKDENMKAMLEQAREQARAED